MPLFFTDLDSTLIYSHRHKTGEPLVWVETLNNRPQSFMSARSYAYFRGQGYLTVIPATARTPRQLQRLSGLFKAMRWREILLLNGALLYVDGKEDKAWTEESLGISKREQPHFDAALSYARRTFGDQSVETAKELFFYVRTDHPREVFQTLVSRTDPEALLLTRDERKVYCQMASLTKGKNVLRYLRRRNETFFLAAGDSVGDLEMLSLSDLCLFPAGLDPLPQGAGKKIACKGFFADEICRELELFRRNDL